MKVIITIVLYKMNNEGDRYYANIASFYALILIKFEKILYLRERIFKIT